LLGACAPAAAPHADSPSVPHADQGVQRPKGTLKLGWSVQPESLNPKLIAGAGVGDYVWLFSSFLTYYDERGIVHPMLAREIPTQENGLWRVNPDGTMVTTYRLRDNARWHDGEPLTAADFAFAYEVYTDPAVAVSQRDPETLMASVEAPDDETIVIHWRTPYIRAGEVGYRELVPLPRHQLEGRYRTNKANFITGAEWNAEFIGTGPFRVERWDPGTGLVARANLDWVLGPPKLESIEVRLIPDPNALVANLMAGEVDMINSPGIGPSHAATARDQWVARGSGYLKTYLARQSYLEFQYREVPGWQRVLTDIRVRQALTHAFDREGLLETLQEGLGAPASGFILPSDPLYPAVDGVITKYAYDPQRAAALLAEAGWQRPAPGGVLANADGEPLTLDIMTAAIQGREATVIADQWKAIGINAQLSILTPARERDRVLRTSFPGAQLGQRGVSLDNFFFVSSMRPRAETGFVELNRGSFQDADIDRFHAIGLTSLDVGARREASIALHKRMSELAAYAPLYFPAEVILAAQKVKGPVGYYAPQTGLSWNAFEWEVVD
jgi:peptide/nickel transport system substrate-binding protein